MDNVLDFFPDCEPGKSQRTKASQVLKELWKRKKIREAGTVPWSDTGRNHMVYHWFNIAKEKLPHETWLSEVFQAWGWPPCKRGRFVDKNLLPDAHLFLGEHEYLVEMDMDTEKREQVLNRCKKLRSWEKTVLFVTCDESRLTDLVNWSGQVQFPLFKIWEDAIIDPWKNWRDPEGNLHELDRSVVAKVL